MTSTIGARLAPIVLLAAATAVLLLGAPAMLRVGFVVLATIAAIALFRTSRTHYIQLCLWLWFLTPLLRRLVDWRTSYSDNTIILSAPFFAAMVSGIVLVRNIRNLAKPGGVPFACAFAGVFFGTVIGLTRYSIVDVGKGLINWLAPLVFGFFLWQERRHLRNYRRAFSQSIVHGLLFMSLYALYQFFLLPAWDEAWMRGLVYSSFGEPVPLKVRSFSTLNSPVVFAFYLVGGLLLLLTILVERKKSSRVLATVTAILAVVALGLTASRSLWLGLVIGIVYLAIALPGRARVRIVAVALAVLLLGGAASLAPGIHDIVVTRLQSFSSGTSDVSASARILGHQQALRRLLSEPLGEGMGSTDVDHATSGADDSIGPHDSTLLELLYSLGGPGALIYAAGVLLGTLRLFTARRGGSPQSFDFALRAAVVAYLAQCLLTSIILGVDGFLLWAFIAFGLAAIDLQEPQSELPSQALPEAVPRMWESGNPVDQYT